MKTEKSTVLPYVLGGKDDPHFIGEGNPPSHIPSQPNETGYPCQCGNETTPFDRCPVCEREDIGGNWTPDRVEANEDIYGNEDDYWSLRDEGRSFGDGESYAERNA